MLHTRIQFRSEIERFIDAGIAYIALTLAIFVRRELVGWRRDIFPMFDFWPEAGWLYVLLVLLWIALFDVFRLYHHRDTGSIGRSFSALLQANLVGVILAFFVFYFLNIKTIPRVLIVLYAVFDVLLMLAKDYVLIYVAPRLTAPKNILLVGSPGEFTDFMKRLAQTPLWKSNILGILSPNGNGTDTSMEEPPLEHIQHLGSTDSLSEHLHRNSVDYVVLSPRKENFDDIQKVIDVCETEGVETWLLGSFFKTSIAVARVDQFQGLPMLAFSTTPAVSYALVFKRVIDIIGSLFLILLTAPIMLAAALAVKLTSPGPVLFAQRRCTLYGRAFTMYKFRTMVTEAEQVRAELEARNEVDGPVFKIKDDPRVTRVGRFMRRYSIDELPQLFNVLRGEMSLVGPRPPIPSEVEKYEDWQRRRLSMRSGITCIWQTQGRNAVTFEDWMRLDLEYIDNWSLGLDLKILARTPLVVFRGTGF